MSTQTPSSLQVTLAILSAGAGAVHFAAMGEHFAVDWRHGLFFASAGWAQLLWAVAVLYRPMRPLLLAGIAGNVAIVSLWGVTRTIGVPFGPAAGRPEPASAPDILATTLEVALICCTLALLDRRTESLRAAQQGDTKAEPLPPAPSDPSATLGAESSDVRAEPSGDARAESSSGARGGLSGVAGVGSAVERAESSGDVRAESSSGGRGGLSGVAGVGSAVERAESSGGVRAESSSGGHGELAGVAGVGASGGGRAGRVGAALVGGLVVVAVGAAFLPVFGTHGHSAASLATDTTANGHQPAGQPHPAQHEPNAAQHDPNAQHDLHAQHDPNAQNPNPAQGDPGAGHSHGDAQQPAVPPSDGERAAADLAVAATKRELPKRWPTLGAAKKAGFAESIDTGGVVHLTKMAWIVDDRVLDPTHPESLVYYRKPGGGSILLGAMYIMPPGAQGPRIGGSLTQWHAHDNLCGLPGGGVALVKPDGTCPQGTTKIPTTPEMLHVWVVDYPEGPFGDATAPALRTAIGTLLAQGA